MKKLLSAIFTLCLLLVLTDITVVAVVNHNVSNPRYRMPQPGGTLIYNLPGYTSYIKKQSSTQSYIFFGDSTVWGANMGRAEAFPYITGQLMHRKTFNLGVPGTGIDDMIRIMNYSLDGIGPTNVILPIQYFWNPDKSQYQGLDDTLKLKGIPWKLYQNQYMIGNLLFGSPPKRKIENEYKHYRYGDALEVSGNEANQDVFSEPVKNYREQPPAVRESFDNYGKTQFVNKTLSNEMAAKLAEIKMIILHNPDKRFYIYTPPYLLSEAKKYGLQQPSFDMIVSQIESAFTGIPNVKYKSFNQYNWSDTDLIDWVHPSLTGAKKLANLMSQWLTED